MGHPKWKEVDLEQKVGIWQRDTCASPDETAMPQPVVAATKPEPAPKSSDTDALLKAIENILTTDSKVNPPLDLNIERSAGRRVSTLTR